MTNSDTFIIPFYDIVGLGRPKKLLILINPRSGKRKAWTKYNDLVAPLLRRCDIDTEVRGKVEPMIVIL